MALIPGRKAEIREKYKSEFIFLICDESNHLIINKIIANQDCY